MSLGYHKFLYLGQSTLAHAVERLRKAFGNNFTTPDIRHSAASLMSGEAGIDPMLADMLLGQSIRTVTSNILATYQPKAFQENIDSVWFIWFE